MMEQNKKAITGNLLALTSMAENAVSAAFLRFGPCVELSFQRHCL